MRIFLSYVDKEDATVIVKQQFDTLAEVTEWVDQRHPEWTRYDVVVVRSKEAADAS
jgi:hypothetical protein